MRVYGLFLILLFCSCAQKPNPWRHVTQPLDDLSPKIYGTVNAGCIKGAKAIVAGEESNYEVMRPGRLRFFGHPQMKVYLSKLSAKLFNARKRYLLVGDVAQPRGGPIGVEGRPMIHASHQTGLDADIWFRSAEQKLTDAEKEMLSAFDLVEADYETMTKHWSYGYYEFLLRTAAAFEEVDRIFVNPGVKRELCIHSRGPQRAQWLSKIRPWWGHADHFHVRLKCPTGDESCVSVGDPIPDGDGCDETLNWWFSEEAKAALAERATKAAPLFQMPDLPKECEGVLPLLTDH